jgi:preprotein translocase subunit SecE
VARDRQRAKQRRAERRSGHPDPLDHASAEVDEARMAEAGAVHPDADDGEAGEIYDDELVEERAERAPDSGQGDAVSARDIHYAEHPRRRRGRVLTFLGHCVDELRRVQWPNRRQVGQATAVVLGFVVVAGGYLGLLDALWKPLIEAIL